MYRGYGKIWNLGHKNVSDIWSNPVHIEEKIDGSQFSFGMVGGKLVLHTHHTDISEEVPPPKMFAEACDYIRSIAGKLHPEWVYRGEVVTSPKHNIMTYERTPRHGIIIFDIDKGQEDYLEYADKVQEAARLDLETVPYHFHGIVSSPDTINTLLDRQPILGGKFIEGIVIKAYGRFDIHTGHTIMAKYVTEKFKEVKKDVQANPFSPRGDFIEYLASRYATEPRWSKAVQHLREKGVDVNTVKAIGPLIAEVKKDVREECSDEIKNALFGKFGDSIVQGSIRGFADWFKKKLMEESFVLSKDGKSTDGGVGEAVHSVSEPAPAGDDGKDAGGEPKA